MAPCERLKQTLPDTHIRVAPPTALGFFPARWRWRGHSWRGGVTLLPDQPTEFGGDINVGLAKHVASRRGTLPKKPGLRVVATQCSIISPIIWVSDSL